MIRFSSKLSRLIFSVLWSVSLVHAAPITAYRGGQPPSDESVVRKLKSALSDAFPQVAKNETWQRKIFDEEVLPLYFRFIKDYRSSQTHSGTAISQLAVDVDLESMKSYLSFHASSANWGKGVSEPPLLLVLKSDDPTCGLKCNEAVPGIKKLMQARSLRRGFKPIWMESSDFAAYSSSLDAVVAKKAVGLMEEIGRAHV